MWPWEHVVFAYLCYSLGCRAAGTRPRGRSAVALLAFGAVLPDLIDKPLAWEWDVFETSYALGHSLFFALPLSGAAVIVARQHGRTRDGVAFAVGYLSHLLGDVVSPAIREGRIASERILWPLGDPAPSHYHGSFVDASRHYLDLYTQAITSGEPDLYLLAQGGIGAVAVGLWIADGLPGVRSKRTES